MKLRFGFRIFLPILILALGAMIACAQDGGETPAPQGLLPTAPPVESARPLTEAELAAIEEFVVRQQSIAVARDQFYRGFDDWRAGLTACRPGAAREAFRDFAADFSAITDAARNLPRASGAQELADLLIAASEAEETAFRQLRDRWQPGNIALLEAVELQRAEAGAAQNSVADMSFQLREDLEDAPTADEVAAMTEFSDTFGEIADAWQGYHDAYAAFAKARDGLNDAETIAGYSRLIRQLKAIVADLGEIAATEINGRLLETLRGAAATELAGLEYLILLETLPEPPNSTGSGTAGVALPPSAAATQVSLPAQEPEPTEPPPATPEPAEEPAAAPGERENPGPSPEESLAAAIEESKAALEEVEQAIEEIVNDKSAEKLAALADFDGEYRSYVADWRQFYRGFTGWRATDGGCDRVAAATELARFSQLAGYLVRNAQDLPQHGFLLPVYALTVAAAEREAGAVRSLASSWAPFAADPFKAADDARLNADRLRRQASIALEELRSR